jgi:hypothetical protein
MADKVGAEMIRRAMIAGEFNTQEGLAVALGITPSALSFYKRKDDLPTSWLNRLAEAANVNPGYVLTGRGPMKKAEHGAGRGPQFAVTVPLIASRHTRKGGYQPLPEAENWPRFEAAWLAAQTKDVAGLLLLKFGGRHMDPEIREDDLALFDPGDLALENGKLYAVRIEEAITVHRILLGAGFLTLRSENRDYPDQNIERKLLGSPQFEVLGRVLALFRKY